jgi:DNA replication protein DnaC
LEIAKQRENDPQSTLELVQSYLQQGNFEDAKEAAFSLTRQYRLKAIKLFRDAIPKPQEKCSGCDNDLEFIFEDWVPQWRKNDCLTCQYQAVKKAIKDNCNEIMHRRGIAKRFLNASLNDFSESYQKQIRTDSGLYLYGPRGTGKTHLMAAKMKNEILNIEPIATHKHESDIISHYSEPLNRCYPLFISVPELLLKLRGTFNNSYSETSEQEILETYSSTNFLFLDDLGTEKASDWAVSTLYLLVERRYSQMLRTIISSNLSLDELADHLDDRISSRIAGMCQVVHMKGKDRRLSK